MPLDQGAERFEWFVDDATAAAAGEFLKFKVVPVENYAHILERLQRD